MGNKSSKFDVKPEFGFQIQSILADSPLANKVDVFLDHIVAINRWPVTHSTQEFKAQLRRNNDLVILCVYNSLFECFKEVTVDVAKQGHTLNLNIQFRRIDKVTPIKVTKVQLGSPAHSARLLNNQDQILGSITDQFTDFDDFLDIVQEQQENKSRLEVLVQNTQSCCIRLCKMLPMYSKDNSQEGLLGAELASGIFNWPPKNHSPVKFAFDIFDDSGAFIDSIMSTDIKLFREHDKLDFNQSKATVIKADRKTNLQIIIEQLEIAQVFLKQVSQEDLINLCKIEKLMQPMFNQYWMQQIITFRFDIDIANIEATKSTWRQVYQVLNKSSNFIMRHSDQNNTVNIEKFDIVENMNADNVKSLLEDIKSFGVFYSLSQFVKYHNITQISQNVKEKNIEQDQILYLDKVLTEEMHGELNIKFTKDQVLQNMFLKYSVSFKNNFIRIFKDDKTFIYSISDLLFNIKEIVMTIVND